MATVKGLVLDFTGVARAGLRVDAFDRGIGGLKLLASAVSDADGRYVIDYPGSPREEKGSVDLELRVFADRASKEPVATTVTRYRAPEDLTINIAVDTAALADEPERTRLGRALLPVVQDRPLADLEPDTIVYVGQRVGWDPRLVAMAAQAETLERETDIPATAAYAMLRAGLPADPDRLATVTDESVAEALARARDAGVLDLDDATVRRTIEVHRGRAERTLAKVPGPGAVSSLGDMLKLRLEPREQQRFISVYRRHRADEDPELLWEALRDNDFDERKIENLRTDATLGRITGQNAPVIGRLLERGVNRDTDLAALGFADPTAWDGVVGDDVPSGISRQEYLTALAVQVELRYPTQVAATLVGRAELGLGDAAGEAERFLTTAADTHTIGKEPVRRWPGFDGLGDQARDGVLRLERLYQITPSHSATLALSKAGIGSARDIVALGRTGFSASHAAALGGTEAADRVYRRAAEVHGAALGLAVGYLAQRTTPPIFAIHGHGAPSTVAQPGGGIPAAGEPGPVAAPAGTPAATLESLFGEFEYCDCAHCRSIFSPAAYLVELLELLDASSRPHTGQNPQAALFKRRPDLQHLLLSCENTNVALPYIDVVNEILEHAVINGGLAGFTGHDTAKDVDSADLLADPQFVADAAYTKTAGAVFPYVLPFDLPLAAFRHLLRTWDTTLPDALLVTGDVAGSRRERLGLNAGELAALTDLANHTLAEHLGEPAGSAPAALDATLGTARALTRRLGIDYEELTALLRTQTINPAVTILPAFEATGLSFDDVRAVLDGTMSAADVQAALPAGLDTTPYGGDVTTWLQVTGPSLLRLVVLHGPDEASFGDLRLRYTDPAGPGTLDELSWSQIHRFVRLRVRLGLEIGALDRLLITHFGVPPGQLTLAGLDVAWSRALRAIGALEELFAREEITARARFDWLALWPERVTGTSPLVAPPPLPADVRRGRLARLLRAGVVDLGTLIDLSGIDPFADDLHTDEPSLHRFVALWRSLKAARLKQVDLDYLLRHHDQAGLAPTEAAARADVKSIRDALAAVDADLTVAIANADPASAVTRVGQVYDQQAADLFFALLDGAVRYETPFASAVDQVPAPVAAVAPGLAIDPFDNVLAHTGHLSAATAEAARNAATVLTVADIDDAEAVPDAAALTVFVAALVAAVDALAVDARADLDALAADAPELAAAFVIASAEEPADRPAAVISAILPALRAVLRAQAVRQVLAQVAATTPQIVAALTGDPAVLPSRTTPTEPVLADLLSLDDPVRIAADGTHELMLDPPVGTQVQLWVTAPAGTTVALDLGPEPDTAGPGTSVLPATPVGPSGEVKAPAAVELTPGRLARATLTVSGLPAAGSVGLAWRTRQSTREKVPAARIIGVAAYERARVAVLGVAKAAALARLLALTPAEIAWFGATEASTAGIFARLATDGTGSATEVAAQVDRLRWLAWFTSLRAASEPDPDVLVGLLADPERVTGQGTTPALAELFGWLSADLTAVLTRTGLALGGLGALVDLRRVSAMMDLVAVTQQPAADLFSWITAAPTPALVTAVREALRTRLDASARREAFASVNGPLREQRRDALVAYLLHHQPPTPDVRTPDQLYEHLLVDVQMGECMETSRIRLALSSVQLFITRCLLDLEIDVEPASVDAARWSWMQRWEADRRVFVYPENWLEPELRPDKSPFFRELEGDLLKSDITDDLAEEAYLAYLKKLDEVARLEISGAWLDTKRPGDPGDDVLYVVGHTNGVTRQYYLRRREGTYWTPWEKISLPIAGDIVFPVVWKKQLYVFWVQAQPKPDAASDSARSKSPSAMADSGWGDHAMTGAEIGFGWGEFYRGKWISPKSSELSSPIVLTGLTEFDPRKLVVNPRTVTPTGLSERLVLDVIYTGNQQQFRVTMTSKHRPPRVDPAMSPPFMDNPLNHFRPVSEAAAADRYVDNGLYRPHVRALETVVDQPPASTVPLRGQTVFTKAASMLPGFTVRPLMQPLADPFEVPFFYGDEHATFWVDVDATAFQQPKYYVIQDFVPTNLQLVKQEPVYQWVGPVVAVGNKLPPLVDPLDDPRDFEQFQHFSMDHGRDPVTLRVPVEQTFTYRGVELGASGIIGPAGRQ